MFLSVCSRPCCTDRSLGGEDWTFVDDGSQVGPLLEQIAGPVASFTGDGAYDRDDVYREVCQRHPDAAVIVPPRSSAVPSATAEIAPTKRDPPAADRRARSHGLAAGIWLQLACPGGGRYRPLQASDRSRAALTDRRPADDRGGHCYRLAEPHARSWPARVPSPHVKLRCGGLTGP